MADLRFFDIDHRFTAREDIANRTAEALDETTNERTNVPSRSAFQLYESILELDSRKSDPTGGSVADGHSFIGDDEVGVELALLGQAGRSLTCEDLQRGRNVVGAGYGADMSSYTESQLRDMLAKKLTVIEPGLRLLNAEQWLRNSHGGAGSVDLFAQDRHGLYVVIEIKRSRSTAREAIGEVTKYTRLLTQEYGIPRRKIRVAVVTMTTDEWHELLVPFSDFAQTQGYDVRGYSLVFNAAGEISGANQIELLPSPVEQRITPHSLSVLLPHSRRARGCVATDPPGRQRLGRTELRRRRCRLHRRS